MTQDEYLSWVRFYAAFPFDDFHRFHRPAALIAQSSAGGDMQYKLDWLQPDPANAGMGDADMNTLRAFGFTKKGS